MRMNGCVLERSELNHKRAVAVTFKLLTFKATDSFLNSDDSDLNLIYVWIFPPTEFSFCPD